MLSRTGRSPVNQRPTILTISALLGELARCGNSPTGVSYIHLQPGTFFAMPGEYL